MSDPTAIRRKAPGGFAPRRLRFDDDGDVPNNPDLPALLMAGVLAPEAGEDAVRALVAANGWGGIWVWTVFDYHHYHPDAHEMLAVVAGRAEIALGGAAGETVSVSAGDVLILPPGTGHRRARAGDGFAVLGAYPPGQARFTTRRAGEPRPAGLIDTIRAVPRPDSDPVFGGEGPAWG